MTTLAVLAAFGAVIVITAEYITHQQASQIAAKDKRIAQLEEDLQQELADRYQWRSLREDK